MRDRRFLSSGTKGGLKNALRTAKIRKFMGSRLKNLMLMGWIFVCLSGVTACGAQTEEPEKPGQEETLIDPGAGEGKAHTAEGVAEESADAQTRGSITAEEGSSVEEEQTEAADRFPYAENSLFDETQVAEVSEYQKLKVLSTDGTVLYETEELDRIADFLNKLDMPRWEIVDSVPLAATGVCNIIRSASPKGESTGALTDIEWITVAQDETGYYLSSMTPDSSQPDDTTCRIGMSYYRISVASGQFLEGLKP